MVAKSFILFQSYSNCTCLHYSFCTIQAEYTIILLPLSFLQSLNMHILQKPVFSLAIYSSTELQLSCLILMQCYSNSLDVLRVFLAPHWLDFFTLFQIWQRGQDCCFVVFCFFLLLFKNISLLSHQLHFFSSKTVTTLSPALKVIFFYCCLPFFSFCTSYYSFLPPCLIHFLL